MSFWDSLGSWAGENLWNKGVANIGYAVRAGMGDIASKVALVSDSTSEGWDKDYEKFNAQHSYTSQDFQKSAQNDLAGAASAVNNWTDTAPVVSQTRHALGDVTGTIFTGFGKAFQGATAGVEQLHKFGQTVGKDPMQAMDDLSNPDKWQQAWHAADPTTANPINMGSFITAGTDPSEDLYTDAGRAKVAKKVEQSAGLKFGTGMTNLVYSLVLDPTKGVGKVAEASRVASTISKAKGVLGANGEAALANKIFLKSRVGDSAVKDALTPDGGATLNVHGGASPQSGYAVAIDGHTKVIPANRWAGDHETALRDITNYVNAKQDLFSQNDRLHLGIWHDPDSGMIYLDPSEVVPNLAEAKTLGAERNQIGIYDLGKGETVNTGGTGEALTGDAAARTGLAQNVAEAEKGVSGTNGSVGARAVGSIRRSKVGDTARGLVNRELDPTSYLSTIDRLVAMTEKGGRGIDAAGLTPVFNTFNKEWGNETSAIAHNLFAQAAKIEDEDLRLAVKRNIVLTAMGSDLARDQLIADMPSIARSMQRQLAGEVENADLLAGLAGKDFHNPDFSLSDYAARIAYNPANAKELSALSKATVDPFVDRLRMLDDSSVTGNAASGLQRAEKIGMTRMQATYARLQQEVGERYTFQSGPGSRTMHVINWATGRVAPGAIDVNDPIVGAEQLANTLKNAKVMDGARIRQIVDSFVASDPVSKPAIVDSAMKEMAHSIGKHYGFSPAEAEAISKAALRHMHDGRRFAARALAKAADDGNERMSIDDFGGSAIQVNKALLQTHLANSAGSLDPTVMHKLFRFHMRDKESMSTVQKYLGQGKGALDLLGEGADLYTSLWKFGVLGRPGLGVRALLDTQLRSVATIGAAASLSNAFKGMGHFYARTRVGDRVATPEELVKAQGLRREASFWRDNADRLGAGRMDGAENAFTKSAGNDMLGHLEQNPYPIKNPKAFRTQEKYDYADRVASENAARIERYQQEIPNTKGAAARARKQAVLDRALAKQDALTARTSERQAAVDTTASEYAKGVRNDAAQPMNRSKVDLMRERADRLDALAYMYENGAGNAQYLAKLGKPFAVKVGGQEINFAAYRGARDADNMSNMFSQNSAPSMFFGNEATRIGNQLRADMNNWHDIKAEDPNWNEVYTHTTNALRNSPTARQVLHMADMQDGKDMLRVLKKDPDARAEYNRIKSLDNVGSFDQWATGVIGYVRYYAPTPELRAALEKGATLTPKEIDRLIPKDQRFSIHGPHMDLLKPHGLVERANSFRDKFFQNVLDKPDLHMVKHPTYVTLYQKNVRKLVADHVANTEGEFVSPEAIQSIDRLARSRAVSGVKKIMYDNRHFTRADQAMRFMMPFIRPWEDAMRTWGKMIYNDPTIAGRMAIAWNTPEMFGTVVDQEGNPIKPFDTDHSKQHFILLPMKVNGLEGFALRKDALNSIAQGSVPWLPGFGPVLQVPAQALLPRIFPDFHDPNNPILKSMFIDGETPKGDAGTIAMSQLPSWVRALWESGKVGLNGDNSPNFARIYATAVSDQIVKAREAGKPIPDAQTLDRNARKTARSAGLMKMAASGILGLTGSANPEGTFYLEQMQQLRAAEPTVLKKLNMTAAEAFAVLYPEAADLNWSISVNDTGVNATVKAETSARNQKALIDKYPEYGSIIVGDDNVGGKFSRSAYQAQFTDSYGPKGQGRHAKTTAQVLDDAQTREGWHEYNKINAFIDTELSRRGLDNIQQSGADDLQTIKASAVKMLRDQNPTWSAAYDKAGTDIETVATIGRKITNEPSLKNRPDMVAFRQYLDMRDAVNQYLKENRVDKATRLQAHQYLFTYGSQLAKSSLGFDANVWQPYFSREFKFTQDQENALVAAGADVSVLPNQPVTSGQTGGATQ